MTKETTGKGGKGRKETRKSLRYFERVKRCRVKKFSFSLSCFFSFLEHSFYLSLFFIEQLFLALAMNYA